MDPRIQARISCREKENRIANHCLIHRRRWNRKHQMWSLIKKTINSCKRRGIRPSTLRSVRQEEEEEEESVFLDRPNEWTEEAVYVRPRGECLCSYTGLLSPDERWLLCSPLLLFLPSADRCNWLHGELINQVFILIASVKYSCLNAYPLTPDLECGWTWTDSPDHCLMILSYFLFLVTQDSQLVNRFF